MRCRLFSFLLLLAFSSCQPNARTRNTGNPQSPDISALVARWNSAHNTQNVRALETLYSDSVRYYGRPTSRAACLKDKSAAFRQHPDYRQQVLEPVQVEPQGPAEVTGRFLKQVTRGGHTATYPAYLVFRKTGAGWKITAESDSVTNAIRARKSDGTPPATTQGDFNGDGVPEATWLAAPPVREDDMDCDGPCTAYIRFSNPTLPTIPVPQCIGGMPANLGDLNGDGGDEIGLLPQWFTSCWASYYVWTLKAGQWMPAVPPFSTHCNQWEDGVRPIEKDPRRAGYALIRYSELTDSDIVTKTKSVPIR